MFVGSAEVPAHPQHWKGDKNVIILSSGIARVELVVGGGGGGGG